MRVMTRLLFCSVAVAMIGLSAPVGARDRDGPDDCVRVIHDWGDAPEGVRAYPVDHPTVIGRFPTCGGITPRGTQEDQCQAPISTPPRLTGYIVHEQLGTGFNYWVACNSSPSAPQGIDSEEDGKMNVGGVGVSACDGGPTDWIESWYQPSFDQDEGYGDGSDSGIPLPVCGASPSCEFSCLRPCATNGIGVCSWNCGPARQVFLNVCVDMNQDGDWNDDFRCPNGACAYEWAVKNAPVLVASGNGHVGSPAFMVWGSEGPTWMRISLSDEAVNDDFPWNGSASMPDGALHGGETEDYPFWIGYPTAVHHTSWGRIKITYR